MISSYRGLPLLLIAAACLGCTDAARKTDESSRLSEPSASAESEKDMPESTIGQAAQALAGAAAEGAAAGEQSTEPAPAEPEQEMVREKATAGITGKGQNIREGIISTPVRAYFTTQERIVFDIQVPQAMNLFRATNGRDPSSHEEFMTQIIEFNKIPLPELRPGHKYVYDPKTAELMVEHSQ